MPNLNRMNITLLIACILCNWWSNAQRTEAPKWLLEEWGHLTQGSGIWIADNTTYKTNEEPFDSYRLEWKWGLGHNGIVGTLSGIVAGKEPVAFWELRTFWHPGEAKALAEQFSGNGTYGVGEIQKESDSTNKMLQSFFTLQGQSYQVGHISQTSTEEHTSTSFSINDSGSWIPDRTYVWKPEPAKLDSVDRNLEIARKSFASFNAHNWEEHARYFSDSCSYLDPSYGDYPVIKSRKEKIVKYREMEASSPDIHDEVTSMFGVGDKVVIQFVSTGTAKTQEGSISWRVPICCVFTFKDGLIVKDETYYNRGN